MRREISWMRAARGLTLIEAALGAALLGTLLTAVVMTNARMTAQTRSAVLRLEACRIAEGLLQSWYSQEAGVPRDGMGDVTDHPGWRWRTRIAENETAAAVRAEAIQLQVFAPGVKEDGSPVVEVELLVAGGNHEKP